MHLTFTITNEHRNSLDVFNFMNDLENGHGLVADMHGEEGKTSYIIPVNHEHTEEILNFFTNTITGPGIIVKLINDEPVQKRVRTWRSGDE